jgi:hypothetical protein
MIFFESSQVTYDLLNVDHAFPAVRERIND